MTLTWLLLIAVVAVFVIGALRFDLLAARWRELMAPRQEAQASPPAVDRVHAHTGLQPHAAPAHKPDFHRSGRRH